jgi:hypothetical protein
MSRNGRFYAEIFKNNQWNPIPSPTWSKGEQRPVEYLVEADLSYGLYTILVGYERWSTYPLYHTDPIIPLTEPRGFPHDMNTIYKQYLGYTEYSQNSENKIYYIKRLYLTWFLVQEVIDYDWNRKFAPFTSYVKSQYAPLFSSSSPFPKDFPSEEKIYMQKQQGMTEVSWTESYNEFLGYGDWFIEELLKLGDPKQVRIIFWLDW